MIKLAEFIERFKLNETVSHLKIKTIRGFIDITDLMQNSLHIDSYKAAKVDSFKVVKDCLIIVVYK